MLSDFFHDAADTLSPQSSANYTMFVKKRSFFAKAQAGHYAGEKVFLPLREPDGRTVTRAMTPTAVCTGMARNAKLWPKAA